MQKKKAKNRKNETAKKKVNRLSKDEATAKLKELDGKGQSQSKHADHIRIQLGLSR